MRDFSKHWDFPERAYPCIHVAGSNGKGSVCLKIATALQKAGYRVGLYTSPHLEHFSERIAVLSGNKSELIKQEQLVSNLQKLLAIEATWQNEARFFELATMLAFLHFRDERVDVAVIETGLGGRLDATNIIDPILTVITSISLEHTQWLGNDLESIAGEKGGIMKAGIPCVLGPTVTQAAIKARAAVLNAPLLQVAPRTGDFDAQNRQIAKQALTLLRPHFPQLAPPFEEALSLCPPCRFELLGSVILDVAHNPAAFTALVARLGQRKRRFLVGLCRDKDLPGCLKVLIPVASHIHLVQACGESIRKWAASPQALAEVLKELRFADYSCHETVAEGMRSALLSREALVVCGSFYIMQEARRFSNGNLS